MADTQTYPVLSPVRKGGIIHKPPATLELTDAEAAELRGIRAIGEPIQIQNIPHESDKARQLEGAGEASAVGADTSAPENQNAATGLDASASQDTDAVDAATQAGEPAQSDDTDATQAPTGAGDPAPKSRAKVKG